jgi:hypothetical protein
VATTPGGALEVEDRLLSCVSITVRSETTSTVSNTFRCAASCRSARKCADQAMEFVFPEPGRVLDEVAPARPLGEHRGHEGAGGVELVVPGEGHTGDLLLGVALRD